MACASHGKTAIEVSTVSSLVAVVAARASAWQWALPAAVAEAVATALSSPRLSAKVLCLGCFSIVASKEGSACVTLLAWALSVAAVLAVMAA